MKQLVDLDFSKQYTYADYLKFRFEERIELLKGYLYKMSPAPSRRHQSLLWRISRDFDTAFNDRKYEVYFAPFDVRLPIKSKKDKDILTVVQPDLCVICDLEKLDDKGCLGAPDLIVEILSPGNSKKEMALKFELYEAANVREYWIVQPEYESVVVYVLENNKFIGKPPFTSENKLVSYIFPELQVNLKRLFEL